MVSFHGAYSSEMYINRIFFGGCLHVKFHPRMKLVPG